jgi:hypothetical protein
MKLGITAIDDSYVKRHICQGSVLLEQQTSVATIKLDSSEW